MNTMNLLASNLNRFAQLNEARTKSIPQLQDADAFDLNGTTIEWKVITLATFLCGISFLCTIYLIAKHILSIFTGPCGLFCWCIKCSSPC